MTSSARSLPNYGKDLYRSLYNQRFVSVPDHPQLS
jgi:hypothetical protein